MYLKEHIDLRLVVVCRRPSSAAKRQESSTSSILVHITLSRNYHLMSDLIEFVGNTPASTSSTQRLRSADVMNLKRPPATCNYKARDDVLGRRSRTLIYLLRGSPLLTYQGPP
ncbi:hypothetical protein BD311DRAFT_568023 [Dichomitus squalens]|uniref:Uncharacterized protein n=1 Tax=Dichomitus squalens TaxID=114155 RepID=A0A4Q9MAL1_9APHY|nr:hypothetical protein BD311DRAFT_568023 [Dichomitus squalens]